MMINNVAGVITW